MRIDIWEVIDAAAPSLRLHALRPRSGLWAGNAAVEPFYLVWRAREVRIRSEFIELAGKMTQACPKGASSG